MIKQPDTQPVVVHALTPWYPQEEGSVMKGQIVGKVTTDLGVHFVIEDQVGNRYRLPTHVDLERKIQAVQVDERDPWLEITYKGRDDEGRAKIYEVRHFPRR